MLAVTDLESAKRADAAAFRRFFTYCLEHKIYFAPSPYETGFISLAHGPGEIAETAEVVAAALKSL